MCVKPNRIAFHEKGRLSSNDEFGRNIIIFQGYNSSSSHTDFLILDKASF